MSISMEHLISGTKVKTNFLCLKSSDYAGGDYSRVLAALNHMFVCSKGEYLFVLVNDTLFGGLIKDSFYTDTQFQHFLNAIKNPGATPPSNSSVIKVSTGFQFTRGEILKKLYLQIEYCAKSEFYISNAVNLYYLDPSFRLPAGSFETNDSRRIFISSCTHLSTSDTTLSYYRDGSDSVLTTTLINKNAITISENLTENTLFPLGVNESNLTYDTSSYGRLYPKLNQSKVKGIDSSEDPYFCVDIDLNKVMIEEYVGESEAGAIPSYNLSQLINCYSGANCFVEFFFNGVSNNSSLTFLNKQFAFNTETSSLDLTLELIGDNLVRVKYKGPTASSQIAYEKVNRIGFAFYIKDKNGVLVKAYFEELHFQKSKRDVLPVNGSASFASDSDIINSEINVNIPFDPNAIGTSANITSSDFIPALGAKYELVLVNNSYEHILSDTSAFLSTTDAKLSKTINLWEFFDVSVAKAFPSVVNFDEPFTIILRRRHYETVRDVFTSLPFSAKKATPSDFVIKTFKSDKTLSNVPLGISGFLTLELSETSKYKKMSDVLPYLSDVKINVAGVSKNISIKTVADSSDLNISGLSALFGSDLEVQNYDYFLFKIPYVTFGAVIPNTIDVLQFNNEGNISGTLSATLEFDYGEIIDINTPYTVGEEAPLNPAVFSNKNISNLKNQLSSTTDALIFYGNSAEFSVDSVDSLSEQYAIYQNSNEDYSFKTLNSSKNFSYRVDYSRIDYNNLLTPNTDPLKFVTKRSVVARDGRVIDTISNEIEIPCIFRKRAAVPIINENSDIRNKIVVSDDFSILNDIKQEITFNEFNGLYSSKLIQVLSGNFMDSIDNKVISVPIVVSLKSSPTVFSTAYAIAEFNIEDNNIKTLVNGSKPYVFDFGGVNAPLYLNGEKISLDLINTISFNDVAITNLSLKKVLEFYIKRKSGLLTNDVMKIYITMTAVDVTLSPSNLERLKLLKDENDKLVFSSSYLNDLDKKIRSNVAIKYFDVVKNGSAGLFVSPLKNLLKHVDLSVVEKESVDTYYTYSDEISLDVFSHNATKVEYKINNASNFIDVPLTKTASLLNSKMNIKGSIDIATPKASEQVVFIRQYDSNGNIDYDKTLKIVRIDFSSISSKVTYALIQDNELNYKNYGKRELVFEIAKTENVQGVNATIKDSLGNILLSKQLSNSNDVEVVSVSVPKFDENYTLQILPYDVSGRTTRLYEYKALFISQNVSPAITVENSDGMLDGVFFVNDNSILLAFEDYSYNNIIGYKVSINNLYDLYYKQSSLGFNYIDLTHLSGKEILSGTYSIKVTPVNLLGNESEKPSVVSVKFAKLPKPIKCELASFNNVVRELNCDVIDYDKDTTDKFVYKVEYTDKSDALKVEFFESKYTKLSFVENDFDLNDEIKSNTNVVLTIYPANLNGHYTEGNKAVIKFKFFNDDVAISHDYTELLSFTKDKNLLILFKPHPYIHSIECKVDNGNSVYATVKDNIFISQNPFNSAGIYNVLIRYTDISGKTFEVQRSVEFNLQGDETYKNSINDETFIDIGGTGPVFYPEFNLNFNEFGHSQLLFVNRNTKREFLIYTVLGKSNIPISFSELGSGNYVFDVYAFSSKQQIYNKFIKSFVVYYLKEKPIAPKFTNNNVIIDGKKTSFTNSKEFILSWASPSDIKLLDDAIGIKIEAFVLKSGVFTPFGEKIELPKTELTSKFTLNVVGNSQFKFALSVLGKNGLYSVPEELIVTQLLKQPNPVVFDLNPVVNPKYVKKSENNAYEFYFKDSENVEVFEKLSKVEIFLNNGTSLGVFDLNSENSTVSSVRGVPYEYKAVVALTDDISTIDLFIVGYDNAGNSSTNNLANAKLMSSQAFGNSNKQYAYFTKIVDSVKPINLNEKTVLIRKNASVSNPLGVTEEVHNAIDVMFDLPDAEACFLKFELLVSTTENVDEVLCSGSTFSKQENMKNIVLSSGIIPDNVGSSNFSILPRDEDILFSNSFENLKVQFLNLHTGSVNKLKLSIVDLSGNCSDWYVIPVEIADLTTVAPYFVKPTSNYVNNETLQFEWDINSDLKILSWEYQFKKEGELKGQTDAHWSSNRTNKTFRKRVFSEKDKTTGYTLYVRGVFGYDSQGNKLCTKENFRSIILDTISPGSIVFVNPSYSNDSSVLRYEWKPTNPNDNIDGYLISFDPAAPLTSWEKNTSGVKVSLGQRDDGAYTLYVIPFDNAGNLYVGEPFTNTIILDTNPPVKVEFDSSYVINTNKIPTLTWLKNYNIKFVRWLVLPEALGIEFVKLYSSLVFNDISDYKYIWDIAYSNQTNVSNLILDFVNNPLFTNALFKNIPVNNSLENSLFVNSSIEEHKNGIKVDNEGSYYVIFVGEEHSGLYTSELNYRKIIYDKTLPNLEDVQLLTYKNVYAESTLSLDNLETFHTVMNVRKPKFVIKTGVNVDYVEFKVLNSSTNKEYTSTNVKSYANVVDSQGKDFRLFSYEQPFNLSEGDYLLSCNLYDNAGNLQNLLKVFTVIDNDSRKLSDTFELFIEEINCYATISQIRNTNSLKIVKINLNRNASLHYREIVYTGFENKYSIYNVGITELDIDKKYEFKVLGYNINENI